MSSLREKIRLAYGSLTLIVVTRGGIAVFDLLFLECQVHEGVAQAEMHFAA